MTDKGDWMKIFDSSKNVGEIWILEKDSVDSAFIQYELAEVMNEYISEAFDNSTLIREVLYTRTTNDSTSTENGYGGFYVWWTQEFGILEKKGLWFGGLDPVMKGTRIGETVYGDTTTNLPPVSIEPEPSEKVAQSFQLSNYPNPFNPTTTISYQMEQPGQVSIKLYTVTGQLVKELLHTYNTSGTYNFQLNGDNLSSGMYILRGRLGEQTETRTITLIK